MSDEANDTKAQKLAAARQKLKAYQNRNMNANAPIVNVVECSPPLEQITGDSMSSSLSEKSDFELISNGHELMADEKSGTESPPTPKPVETIQQNAHIPLTPTVASYFSAEPSNEFFTQNTSVVSMEQPQINALQVVIAEKAQLASELNKFRAACREKDLELEELRTQFSTSTQRQEELQERCQTQHQVCEQLRKSNAELQHKLAQVNAHSEDQTTYLNELQKQLKEQFNELEMTQIRLRQLDDESNISRDNRVETLTQTKFMYEQQIRDLQAMVQQLNQDKEQSNTQYQNYVKHLSSEVTNLTEKNNELIEECAKLQERERQLIDHVSGLERDIQKNISRQQEYQAQAIATPTKELESLQAKIDDFELEGHEFRLKIKSQEDRLVQLQTALQQSQDEANQLREQMMFNAAEQPDQTKLLATMESDKIAASRALSQNEMLKKQLSELEERFVQLTNDKAELVNQRDAEEFANREMRNNYAALEQRLNSTDERLKFKDEEMIRLSHENVELEQKILQLQQKLDGEVITHNDDNNKDDQTDHHHDHTHHDHTHHDHDHDHSHHDHEHSHHDHDHSHHDHDHIDTTQSKSDSIVHAETDDAVEVKEDVNENPSDHHRGHEKTQSMQKDAVEKLEQRFTHLISQVADLTDEKHRLEHLVLQLQSETETIGEYIALYQTQRRMLKQREYEKAAQMQMLHEERERMRDKINELNELVSSLGVELPPTIKATSIKLHQKYGIGHHLNAALAENVANEPTVDVATLNTTTTTQTECKDINRKLQTPETREILMKIQHIISEIKEKNEDTNTLTPTLEADHLKCCLGKFEVV